jgi:hypothetical protein
MTRLDKLYRKFLLQLNKLQDRAIDIETKIAVIEPWRARYMTESLIQDLWHHWQIFVKELIFYSCGGCRTRSNNIVPPRVGDNTWQRVGYEAIQAVRGNNIKPGGLIRSIRQEPTWADLKNIILILNTLAPANKNELISAFGIPLRGPKDLHIIRNACAHKHGESMGEIRGIQIYYLSSQIKQPSDLIWQKEMASKQIGFFRWLDDFKIIADLGTSTP